LALLTRLRRVGAAGILFVALTAAPTWASCLDVGERLDELELVDRSGAPIAAAELAGKVVILDFWATWCAPCRPALGALEGLARRYGDAGLVVLAVSADGDREAAEAYVEEHFAGSAIRFVFDPGGRLLASVGAPGLPALYLLDRDRVLRVAETGFSAKEMADVENEVASLVGRPRRRQEGPDLVRSD
jgi:thiol-disulfide isomerase/thioredoxin